ncbi:MAG: peptide ABC transporter permease [Acidimicrobiia bacterium]|nr:MAG: peptide ABC transporter permease [Acidimicrobiia bacterium]
MLGFILRRILVSIPVLAVASFVVFLLVASAGDPLADLRALPGVSEETIRVRERELGLDRPLLARYGEWAGDVLRGDLGHSTSLNEPVDELLLRRLGVTFRLVLAATVVGVVLAVAVGVWSARRPGSVFDHSSTVLSFVFFSMPVFWLAAVLKDLGIRVNDLVGRRIFFTVGEETPGLDAGLVATWADRIGHLLLPSLTLVLISVAGWSRYQRASMIEALQADYVRTARAKGLTEGQVLRRHALRNALLPVVTVVALDFSTILGGAVLTETVFGWKGMGVLLVESLQEQDTDVVLGWLLVTAALVIVGNLVADVCYGLLDPRIRRG